MVWLTIQRNTRELHKITDKNEANSSKDKKQSKNKNNEVDVPASVAAKIKLMKRNAKVAKLFCLLVAASLCQWWPSIIYGIWMFFGDPPNVIILLTVIFVNSGGIFNGIAYTVMRFKSLNNENKKKQTMKGKMTTSTCTVSTVTWCNKSSFAGKGHSFLLIAHCPQWSSIVYHLYNIHDHS